GTLVSPDGKLLVASDDKGNPQLYPLAGGEPKAIAGLGADDIVIRWGPSEGSLYVARPNELPTKVYRLDLGSGRKELVKELLPSDPAGILGPIGIFMTPDARAYVYGVNRTLSNLFIEEGLK